ncbi:MAG TPA: pseudaminic acid biosynthesis-associated methylase [Myxococcota bacterium]|jgi:pseudaminic acid biosynthesis-associated methylase|nr:pseudaminic acid biosynthesis-associated methylase [Myxococcota bacterium]
MSDDPASGPGPSSKGGAETPRASRLESLWQGAFGDDYTKRNADTAQARRPFWTELLGRRPCERVLEVGCNLGANLESIATLVPPRGVFGLDVNEGALVELRAHLPRVNAVWGLARELPFRDRYFDLVFTTGVLIHQPPDMMPVVMGEIVRCSRRYVLAGEYHSETLTEVPYRGQPGALYKRDFGALYRELHPELRLLDQGFLSVEKGWDDVTYWLFERPE